MTITLVGALFAALFLVCLVGGRSGFVYAIAVSLFFNDSAMFVVGDSIGVTPYTVALAIAVLLQISFVIRTRIRGRATLPLNPMLAGSRAGTWLRRALALVLGYGVLISAVGPGVFAGFRIMPSQGSYDYLVDDLPPLEYTVSNWAQIVYLVLNIGLIWYLASLPRVPRRAFAVGIGVGLGLTVVAAASRLARFPWPYALFDNSPRNYYAVLADDPRLRAQFSEPSHLAWFLTLAIAYATFFMVRRPMWRALCAALAVLVCIVGIAMDPSTTVILALGALVPASVVVAAIRYRHRWLTKRGLLVVAGVAVLALAVVVIAWGPIMDFAAPALFGKIGSSSQYSRGKQDLNSLSLVLQSYGLGVGLGSNRSSSLATMLLSNLGVVGTLAYYAVVVLSVVVLARRGARAEAWALVAVALACAISVADFVSPPTWFLIGIAAQLSRPSARFGGVHRLPVAPNRIPAMTGVGR